MLTLQLPRRERPVGKSYTRATTDEPFTDTTSLDIERERLARVEAEQAHFKQRLLEEACLTHSLDTNEDDA